MNDVSLTSDIILPLRIGQFGVLAFHGFQPDEAAQVHVECRLTNTKSRELPEADTSTPESTAFSTFLLSSSSTTAVREAVVIDHRFIFSFSQLCVALHRLQCTTSDRHHLGVSTHLQVYKALSCSHNSQSLLHQLPPGPVSKAVVIIWLSPESSPTPHDPPSSLSSMPDGANASLSSSSSATFPLLSSSSSESLENAVGTKRHRPASSFPSSPEGILQHHASHPPTNEGNALEGEAPEKWHDKHQSPFALEARAIFDAVRRSSRSAVFHPLTSSSSSSVRQYPSCTIAKHSHLITTANSLTVEQREACRSRTPSHQMYYTPYVDWSSILAFYRIPEKKISPAFSALPLSSSSSPHDGWSSSTLPSQQEKAHSHSPSATAPTEAMWHALKKIVITKLSTYDL